MGYVDKESKVNKRFGIDIDGTINDLQAVMDNHAVEFANKNHIVCTFNSNEYGVENRYNFNSIQAKLFWNEYAEAIYEESLILSGAVDFINSRHKDGDAIFFITARETKFKELTEKYLRGAGIVYTKLFIGIEDKASLAEKLNINYFFEDYSIHIKSLLDVVDKVFSIKHDHNKHLRGENLIFFESWEGLEIN